MRVRGAREHNLRGIDVDIPRDQLIVVTGLSGSGKSSLAFDTIFAEGQRKYMESLSAYARQFLDQLQKPNVETIEGLPPTIAIEQRASGHNPRSTVATTTEIYDYLRLLFARCGTPRCWHGADGSEPLCDRVIQRSSATQIVDAIMALPEGTKLMLLAPLVRGKKGYHRDVLEKLQTEGFVRARVNGGIIDLREALKEPGENPLNLGRYEQHSIEAVIDRVIVRADGRGRMADSVETGLRLGEGLLIVSTQQGAEGTDTWLDQLYSEHFACPVHPECSLPELEPRLFSFNSPFGACPTCLGLGTIQEFDLDLIVDDPSLTIAEGAISAFAKIGHAYRSWFSAAIRRACKRFGIDMHTPFASLPREHRSILLDGSGQSGRKRNGKAAPHFTGVIPILKERFANTQNERVKERLSMLLSQTPCPACRGRRLRVEALHVFLTGPGERRINIADFTEMTVEQADDFAAGLVLTREQQEIARPILKEILARLGFLRSVGLGYLNLNRRTGTLSGGEAQRIRLATQVGTGLVGVCYVLDEPTIGLHQRDNDRLIATLRHLSDIGNTVIVVEHDEDMIRAADHILDLGPGPGVHGGLIVAQGDVAAIIASKDSITGQYLSGRERIELPQQRREMSASTAITVKGASANNLKNIDVSFPLGGVICVTGVSGSGKSTLVNEVLLKAVRRHLSLGRDKPGEHKRITGLNKIDRIIDVDQSPIGRTPRSNPATYTGFFDDIRKLFTKTKEARVRGYQPGRFSFNVKGGRCEVCEGQGTKKIEMHFLPDVYVECEACGGTRYNRETLEITFKGKNIAQVLAMTVEEGVEFFEAHPAILRMLECLHDVGLDYIQIGQPSTTLSGGEAQRIKLAAELGKGSTLHGQSQHTLYILDEPTTGLHFADIKKLLSVLNRLAEQGNTLVVIEHNLDVVKCADWIIDLGPEGGEAGGSVVAAGTPEDVMRIDASHTGRWMRKHLGGGDGASPAKPRSAKRSPKKQSPAPRKKVRQSVKRK
ncbi:MAG: excinuclease ABC subunit UvrA [Phycisphaerales bacterium]|nr:excinuclease ABC subunit UvrA [Phycisphaerales bacterium]